MKTLILIILLSSCSARINGVRVPDKTSSKMDEKSVFFITVSFWLSYGISYHFFHSDQ